MKISAPQFFNALNQTPLKSCYWLAGDEPLQASEAQQALRAAADCDEHIVFDVSANFDWQTWRQEMLSGSLLCTTRLVELRLHAGKLGEAAQSGLSAYLERPNPDVLLLIVSPKLEQHAATQKVLALIETQGVVCQFWPLERAQLPAWLMARMKRVGLSASEAAIDRLVDFVEGNLLAAQQAIDFLALLHPKQVLDEQQIESSLVRQARFNVFHLSEALLGGDTVRYNSMLFCLKAEGVEAVLVLWALVKEIRLMLQLSELQRLGPLTSVQWLSLGIWDKRRPLYQKALQSRRDWSAMLILAAHCDVLIKGHGVVSQDPWLCFSRFCA